MLIEAAITRVEANLELGFFFFAVLMIPVLLKPHFSAGKVIAACSPWPSQQTTFTRASYMLHPQAQHPSWLSI